MHSVRFECRLFDSMLEVIVATLYRHLMSVYSGCLNFCYGSCASLCIIAVSRDWIVNNVLEINGTDQKTVKTIKILRTNMRETSTVNWLQWLNRFLKYPDNPITSLNSSKHGSSSPTNLLDDCWRMWRRIRVWGPMSETNFPFCWCSG